ncbi:PcfJ domain-containing protein [Pararhizobium sp. BT-229]|uniref:PcfJ domain-containing protein n=1 Tax=Pararhizobium sp. BT-229 TaxID=2986923 RepID=UPI0021F7E74A|nr:PcfJ domain-containing protein [Pararhizobium sp. BT-229]MCV9964353.1 PcfJ domain-containing protein [Pararhizobium sp. BT-229]
MAGTGHRYEVSNPAKVSEYAFFLKLKARERQLDTAEAWLGSRHFIKFLTSETFTFRLKPAHVTNSTNPDEKRQHILAKIVDGEEVRRFDPELFETLGPDISHILDWVEELKTTGNRTYRKIARMETSILVAKADAWTKSLNSRKLTSDGAIDPVLSINEGLKWFELKDANALHWEGAMMSHCVGSHTYARSVSLGETRIFSLRKDVHKPILTVEVRAGHDGFSLVQIQKHANGGLPIAYCEAAANLLNEIHARDANNVARRYALCRENGRWATIFDTWTACEFHGRKVLGDGRNILFMCATDDGKPLALMSALAALTPGKWDEAQFDPAHVSLRPADDSQPHYLDQIELCAIANIIAKGGRAREYSGLQVNWMRINEDGEFVPYVDRLDRVEMTDGFFYTITLGAHRKTEYFLPHSSDPARIIMTAKEKNHALQAHVNAGQRVSRAETPRVLAFLTSTKTRWLDRDADAASRTSTTEFLQHSKAMLVPGLDEWRSFAADLTETPAKNTPGKWQETDYLLRYLPGSFSSVDIYVKDRAVSHVSGTLVDGADLIEISRRLCEKRIVSDKFLLLSVFGSSDRVSVLFMRNGKWTWANEKNFARRARETIDALDKSPGSVSGIVLSGLLGITSFLLKKATSRNRETLSGLKSRLLVAWFTHADSFDGHPFRRARIYPSLGAQADYPVMDRMIDLANQGFGIEGKKERSQFRKFLAALSTAYGKGRVDYLVEKEYVELLVVWHMHMPKKFFNKVSSLWLTIPSLSSADGAARTLEILYNVNTRGTRFREAVSSHAEQFLAGADYAAMKDDDLAQVATLFLVIAKARYLYGRYVEAMARLVGELERKQAGDPEVRAELKQRLAYLAKKEVLPTLEAA